MNKTSPNFKPECLLRGPRGLRLDAKVAYREGHTMLTVYGFYLETVETFKSHASRIILHRVFVPTALTKAEKHSMLRALCDLLAVQYGEAYYLRSKLQ